MKLTVEKVILLKATEFFSTIEDDILAEVATTLVEQTAAPGERIIEQGESGSNLFLIVSGRLRVHNGATVRARRSRPGGRRSLRAGSRRAGRVRDRRGGDQPPAHGSLDPDGPDRGAHGGRLRDHPFPGAALPRADPLWADAFGSR
jgi:hypothetical protein